MPSSEAAAAATEALLSAELAADPGSDAAPGQARALLQELRDKNRNGARDMSGALNELAAAGKVERVSSSRGQRLSAGTISALCALVGNTGAGPCKRNDGDRRRLLQERSADDATTATAWSGLARALLQKKDHNGQGDSRSGARAPDFNALAAAGNFVRVDTSRGPRASAGTIAAYCSQAGSNGKAPCKRDQRDK